MFQRLPYPSPQPPTPVHPQQRGGFNSSPITQARPATTGTVNRPDRPVEGRKRWIDGLNNLTDDFRDSFARLERQSSLPPPLHHPPLLLLLLFLILLPCPVICYSSNSVVCSCSSSPERTLSFDAEPEAERCPSSLPLSPAAIFTQCHRPPPHSNRIKKRGATKTA